MQRIHRIVWIVLAALSSGSVWAQQICGPVGTGSWVQDLAPSLQSSPVEFLILRKFFPRASSFLLAINLDQRPHLTSFGAKP
jgi:hypothetical protein